MAEGLPRRPGLGRRERGRDTATRRLDRHLEVRWLSLDRGYRLDVPHPGDTDQDHFVPNSDNYPEVNYVAHTHPTYTNQILCSEKAYSFAEKRLFPDQVVRNGRKSCLVPYATPGKELREEIKKQIGYFVEEEEFFPKLILLENHGIITTGSTHTECIASTLMCEKSAEIFIGAKLLGQIKYLTEEEIAAVDKCPNEAYRRKLFQ